MRRFCYGNSSSEVVAEKGAGRTDAFIRVALGSDRQRRGELLVRYLIGHILCPLSAAAPIGVE